MENVVLSSINLADLENVIFRQVQRALTAQATNQPTSGKDEILSMQEAAGMLSVAIPTMYGYVYRKEIPYMKRRGRLYFSKTELLDWLKSTRRPTKDEIQQAAKESLNR